MSYAERYSATVTTDASGDATAYLPGTAGQSLTGRIINVIYTADGTSPYDATADFTITLEATGQTVWQESNLAASKTVAPRQATHATDGTASLFAGAGEPVEDYIVAAKDRLKIVVAQGGNAKKGSFTVVVG